MKKTQTPLPHRQASSFVRFFRAFYFAGRGFVSALRERNMKFHIIVSIVVLVMGFYFDLTNLEWTVVLILMGLVLSAEMFNTAIEELADICREQIPLVYEHTKRARDVAAGAVLVLAIVAAILGSLIFWPYIAFWLG